MPLSRTRDKARKRVYRAGRALVKAAVVDQLTAAIAKRGISVDDLIDEWTAIATGPVQEPLTWVAKTKALSELSARLWPVPRDKEQPSGPVTNNLVFQGYTVEQLRELLGKMDAVQEP